MKISFKWLREKIRSYIIILVKANYLQSLQISHTNNIVIKKIQ